MRSYKIYPHLPGLPFLLSIVMLFLVAIVGLGGGGRIVFSYLLILPFLVAGFSSFIRSFKSYFLVSRTAAYSANFVNRFIPDVEIVGGPFSLQAMISPVKFGFSKVVGKGFLVLSKLVELLVLVSGGVISLFYLIFVWFGYPDPAIFLGFWVISLAILFLFVDRVPNIVPLNTMEITPLVGLDISAWLIDVMAVWIALALFGYQISPASLFLPFSLVILSTKVPLTFYGLGLAEFVGVLILFAFHVMPLPAFLSILIWDIGRLASGLVLTYAWRNLEMRREMRAYV